MEQAPVVAGQLLTEEAQRHFIESWAWGPTLGPFYFGAMGAWREVAILVAASVVGTIIVPLFFVPLLVSGYYVAMGRKVAWQAHSWASFEEFRHVQHRWDVAARIWMVASVVFVVGLFFATAWWISSTFSQLNLHDLYQSLPYLQ